jgi:hypothetical protein
MMKWALLGGAALAVTASGAYADDLAALKAELEALKSRVHELEAKPAPAQLPEGYSLLSIRKGSDVKAPMAERKDDRMEQGDGVTLSVLPAADAAPTTEVTVQGEVRTQLRYDDFDFGPAINAGDVDDMDVQARARLNVTGKTETAVGEVGVFIRVQGNVFDNGFGNGATIDKGWGWWRITPVWTLTAGYLDNTSAVQAGIDWDFNFGGFGGITNTTVEQMRLTYNDRQENGPFSFAIAVEDPSEHPSIVTTVAGTTLIGNINDRSDFPGIAGYIMYNGDNVMFQVTGHVEDDDSDDFAAAALDPFVGDTDWFVGAGARIGLGDMLTFTAAGGYGEGYNRNQALAVSTIAPFNSLTTSDDEYWGVSAGIIAKFSDDLSAEVGGAYGETDSSIAALLDTEAWGATAGLYWSPVSQLKLGWQAEYTDVDGFVGVLDSEFFTARFVTWMSF